MNLVRDWSEHESKMLTWIADFFDFHAGLVGAEETTSFAEGTLASWCSAPSELYLIEAEGEAVGFLRLNFKGDIAAWLEDIYIAPKQRGRGLAEQAIALAEDLVRAREGYQALCLDVAPRNERALRLYQRLGFTDLSLITLRKEFGESRRDKTLSFLDLELHY